MDSDDSFLDFATIAFKLGYMDESDMLEVQNEGQDAESQMKVALAKATIDAKGAEAVKEVLQPIHTIENYKIVDVLGRGGMGVVYKAIQVNLERPVALKTILMEKVSETTIARFEREARSMAKIQHPNIINVYDYGQKADQFFFAMEFVDGQDAQKLVRTRNRVPEDVTWGIIRQVAAGLSHAWKAGIVHRDIKPANILLLAPPEGTNIPGGAPLAKIADFGLAYQEESISDDGRFTEEKVILGSPSYMSPEQFEGTNVDFRSDIYSLGSTAYELLSGVRPFKGLSITKLMAAKSTGELPLAIADLETSERSKQLMRKMMATEWSDRYASYADLIAEIDELLAHVGPEGGQSIDQSFEVVASGAMPGQSVGEATVASADKTQIDVDSSLLGSLKKRALPAAILVFAVVFVFLTVMVIGEFTKYRPGERNLVPGKTVHLYFGQSLEGWPLTPISGKWGTESDPKGSHPIFGVKGIHSRPFQQTPMDHYRIETLVWLHGDAVAQLQFAISNEKNQYATVSISKSLAEVYYQNAEEKSGRTYLSKRNIAVPDDDYIGVAIEKQDEDWFVYVDNIYLGALPIQSTDDLQELRIAAVDGKVWFNQLTLTELVQPN